MDELDCAEATLTVLQEVLAPIGSDDLTRQTACREYDVSSLTDHLMGSITTLGGAAGAEFPERDTAASVHAQVDAAARPALDAWRRRGLDGTVSVAGNDFPAQLAAGILSIEFLVHAWDYASATGARVNAPDDVSDYVHGLARTIITPEGRSNVGFDTAVEVGPDARALDRLIAFTGRKPVG